VGLDGDDAAVLIKDLPEDRDQQLAPLGRLGLQVPEAREVVEQRAGLVEGGVGGRAEALVGLPEMFDRKLAFGGE
jgi:hypothetical protein